MALPPSATPALQAALDARLAQIRSKSGIPDISVTVIFADGSAWHGNAGLADVAARRPVTSETAFSVASISKTYTAALILGLIEDGRLRLDSTAKPFLPTVAIDPRITVRQLLDHTSGLRDFYFDPRIDKALLSTPRRVWDAKRSLGYVGKPYGKPGAAWHYSNTNYVVLGLLAEAVGRAPIATQLRQRFFIPLGLQHTWYQGAETAQGAIARGYRFTGAAANLPPISLSDGSTVAPFTSVVTASGGAGSIASSADDLARWAAALYGGDTLPQGIRDAMIGDLVPTAKGELATGYGLGVQVVDIEGRRTYGHSGRFLGARTAVRWLAEERITIAVLTNQSRTDANAVLADLLKVIFPPPPPPPPAPPTPGPSPACPTCLVVR
jgi:D-alanyl-D-alanine carboxypeptidase